MDLNKIHGLLNDKIEDDDDINEDDLEDELEAILNGRPVGKKTTKPSRPAPTKPEKSRPSRKPPTNNNKNVQGQRGSNKPLNDPMLDISQIEKMLNNFDIDNLPDDDNIDDTDLISELDDIMNSSDSVSKASPRTMEPEQKRPLVPQPITEAQFVPRQSKLPKVDNSSTINVTASSRPQIQERINIPTDNRKEQQVAQVKQLQVEYKRAALKAKTNGDKESALAHMKVSKQLDSMINSLNADEEVDISSLPPMPQESSSKPSSSISAAPSASTVTPTTPTVAPTTSTSEAFEYPEVSLEDASNIFHAPKSANSVFEALQQRLDKFKDTQAQAAAEQNASKARRLGRIVKQYEVAIKNHKSGKPIDYDELPCPPGFPPIPTQVKPESTSAPVPPSRPSKPAAPPPPQPKPLAEDAPPKPAILTNPSTNPQTGSQQSQSQATQKPPLKRGLSTTGSKQLKYLMERQKLFREAALEAKKRGEMEQAKEYLRTAKGFDPLIEATKNGLPIEVTSIPTPPQLNNEDFVIVDETIEKIDSSSKRNSVFYTDIEKEELFRKIEKELIDQIEMCNRNKEYFLKMGDINTSSKFENYAKESRKDLNMLVVRWRNGDNIPSYRTETRTFSIVVSNHEVGLNELQVDIVKAFDLPGKPEIDTYVRAEFPIPSEKPQTKKTKTIYNTINPEYNESIKFEIDRKSRSLPRALKRHPLKLEIFSKGGFLRSDTRLGAILLKLSDLETKCTLHECIQLTEGRKTLSGRLEVKIKLREPLLAKQIEEIKEKWIVFS